MLGSPCYFLIDVVLWLWADEFQRCIDIVVDMVKRHRFCDSEAHTVALFVMQTLHSYESFDSRCMGQVYQSSFMIDFRQKQLQPALIHARESIPQRGLVSHVL